MSRKPPVLMVLGMMGRTPFAGVAWQVLHYLEGLRRLGYEPYYVEFPWVEDWLHEHDTFTGSGHDARDDLCDCTAYIALELRHTPWIGLHRFPPGFAGLFHGGAADESCAGVLPGNHGQKRGQCASLRSDKILPPN
jgi:hypothetical protein